MHHSDPASPCIDRIPELPGFAGNQNGASVRSNEAERDLHQSALARSILSKERMDLPYFQGEINLIERLDRSKALGDATKLECRSHIPVG